MVPFALSFDVSSTSPTGESLQQAAWTFLEEGTNPQGVMVCLAGGTYDWHYWHLEVPGHPGYSFAQHLASLGWLVVAVDHLGSGESSDPGDGPIGLERLRDGDMAVVRQIMQDLRAGSLIDGLGSLTSVPIIGVGHSMGACITTMIQAEWAPYDGVVLLGYGVDIVSVTGEPISSSEPDERVEQSERIFRERTGAGDSNFHLVPRAGLRGRFHAPDVPEAVRAADDAVESRVPVRAAAQVTTPGFVRRHAATVTVPVFLGFGGHVDVSPDPYMEPANYRGSSDITLCVLNGSAHCHNMASTRIELWNRVEAWASGFKSGRETHSA